MDKEQLKKTFTPARLRTERERIGYKVGEFAEKLGTTRQTQTNYERLSRKPDTEYLEKAAELGIDVYYLITGVRFTSQPYIAKKLKQGESIEEFFIKLSNNLQPNGSDSADQDKTADSRLSFSKSTRYRESDQDDEKHIKDPISQSQIGSKVHDASPGSGGALDPIINMAKEPNTVLNKAELSSIGKVWWDAVSELSDEERNAVLTLVFDHVIAKFIELNTEKVEGSDQLHRGIERLSTYLNSHGPYSVDKQKAS